MTEKKLRGFALMDKERVSKIAIMGGKAAHANGKGRVFNSETAREAALKRHAPRKN